MEDQAFCCCCCYKAFEMKQQSSRRNSVCYDVGWIVYKSHKSQPTLLPSYGVYLWPLKDGGKHGDFSKLQWRALKISRLLGFLDTVRNNRENSYQLKASCKILSIEESHTRICDSRTSMAGIIFSQKQFRGDSSTWRLRIIRKPIFFIYIVLAFFWQALFPQQIGFPCL